ncbi:alkene reductase [Oscillatoriales cyanobacterium LEGE 11467]|uniref:Alkene reductase n=1 Tax=Zarconia navalis LEGE 11467 TaxID=1828826 RepID=A0A928Z8U5_9CYAN|nr:alkene reductase [Zarconia navalis]MBE9040181.1 alkene reductase [Zarconia navalis LEGE 11467]
MSDRTTCLLNPGKIGDLTLPNRVVMAPLTRSRAGQTRMPNALMREYYTQRASAGLIISEATVVSQQANGWLHTPGIYSDAQANAWKSIVDAVRTSGGRMFLQLWHCGRASHSSFQPDGQLPVAPSPIKIESDEIHTPNGKQPHEVPRGLETEEIPQIVENYRLAAQRAKGAGFDGIEIHSANGYLLDTFLQSKTNQRSDRYGGSLENRSRFLKETVEAVSTVFPADRIGVRLSPNGVFNDMGSPDFRETFLYVAEQLDTYGLAYLHFLDGLAFGFHELGEPMTLAEFRQVFSGPLMGNCGYDRNAAEAAIEEGTADFIAFGRPYISNPDLVERFANDWPLNPPADQSVWYSFEKEGYTDFPFFKEES